MPEGTITIGKHTFQTTTLKIKEPYKEIIPGSFLIKKKYTTKEIAEIINEIIILKKKFEKKNKKLNYTNNE